MAGNELRAQGLNPGEAPGCHLCPAKTLKYTPAGGVYTCDKTVAALRHGGRAPNFHKPCPFEETATTTVDPYALFREQQRRNNG